MTFTENIKNESIAILIPCFNEEVTIGKVITDFQRILPSANIYVFDNNSTDNTNQVARENGANVIREKRKGKGYVVQSMFRKVDADYYVIVDGDDTYPAEAVTKLLNIVMTDCADMATGNRLQTYESKAFRAFHVIGNNLVRLLVNKLFHASLRDIMSGYRAINRDVVHGISITSKGFEVEAEMTLQCLDKEFIIKEVDVHYGERPPGSYSKLRTLSDGLIVLKSILIIFRDYKPLVFFGWFAALFFVIGMSSGSIVIREFFQTQYITHVPLAILSVGLVLSSFLMLGVGLILDSIKNRFKEIRSYIGRKGYP